MPRTRHAKRKGGKFLRTGKGFRGQSSHSNSNNNNSHSHSHSDDRHADDHEGGSGGSGSSGSGSSESSSIIGSSLTGGSLSSSFNSLSLSFTSGSTSNNNNNHSSGGNGNSNGGNSGNNNSHNNSGGSGGSNNNSNNNNNSGDGGKTSMDTVNAADLVEWDDLHSLCCVLTIFYLLALCLISVYLINDVSQLASQLTSNEPSLHSNSGSDRSHHHNNHAHSHSHSNGGMMDGSVIGGGDSSSDYYVDDDDDDSDDYDDDTASYYFDSSSSSHSSSHSSGNNRMNDDRDDSDFMDDELNFFPTKSTVIDDRVGSDSSRTGSGIRRTRRGKRDNSGQPHSSSSSSTKTTHSPNTHNSHSGGAGGGSSNSHRSSVHSNNDRSSSYSSSSKQRSNHGSQNRQQQSKHDETMDNDMNDNDNDYSNHHSWDTLSGNQNSLRHFHRRSDDLYLRTKNYRSPSVTSESDSTFNHDILEPLEAVSTEGSLMVSSVLRRSSASSRPWIRILSQLFGGETLMKDDSSIGRQFWAQRYSEECSRFASGVLNSPSDIGWLLTGSEINHVLLNDHTIRGMCQSRTKRIDTSSSSSSSGSNSGVSEARKAARRLRKQRAWFEVSTDISVSGTMGFKFGGVSYEPVVDYVDLWYRRVSRLCDMGSGRCRIPRLSGRPHWFIGGFSIPTLSLMSGSIDGFTLPGSSSVSTGIGGSSGSHSNNGESSGTVSSVVSTSAVERLKYCTHTSIKKEASKQILLSQTLSISRSGQWFLLWQRISDEMEERMDEPLRWMSNVNDFKINRNNIGNKNAMKRSETNKVKKLVFIDLDCNDLSVLTSLMRSTVSQIRGSDANTQSVNVNQQGICANWDTHTLERLRLELLTMPNHHYHAKGHNLNLDVKFSRIRWQAMRFEDFMEEEDNYDDDDNDNEYYYYDNEDNVMGEDTTDDDYSDHYPMTELVVIVPPFISNLERLTSLLLSDLPPQTLVISISRPLFDHAVLPPSLTVQFEPQNSDDDDSLDSFLRVKSDVFGWLSPEVHVYTVPEYLTDFTAEELTTHITLHSL